MHYRRWGISIENLTYFFIPKSSRKYSHTNFYNFAMTHISQDDHLTAGAWYFLLGIWLYFLLLREVVNIPIQTLMISPWLLSCKMMISQLELGPPVVYSAWVYHHKERDAGLLAHQQCVFYVVSKNVIKSYKEPIDLTTQSSSVWSESIL